MLVFLVLVYNSFLRKAKLGILGEYKMLHLIAQMYVTLGPVILAGIFNMIFCKLKILKSMQVPMDGGRVMRDGNRIFGDNKTWKGFL